MVTTTRDKAAPWLRTGKTTLRLYLSALLVVLASQTVAAKEAQQSSQVEIDTGLEKAYQQVLYAYFQDDLASALLQIALLELRYPDGLQRIPAHLFRYPLQPQLLKGSISLDYGLEDQAAVIFNDLLPHYAVPDERTQAWFALGQRYYQQGQWHKAGQAFSQIDEQLAQAHLATAERDQLVYWRAQLYQLHGEGLPQDNPLQHLSVHSIYHYYLRYNQALESLQQGHSEQAISQLTDLLAEPQAGRQQILAEWLDPFTDQASQQHEDEQQEILALHDRINLTLGYTLLQQGKARQAYEVFARIRREGLDGDAAVLGYGWAALKDEELQIALGIWQSLMALPEHTEYSLEAYLAAALAYEKGFAPRQAVATLQAALHRFKQVLDALSRSHDSLNDRAIIMALAQGFEPANPSLDLPARVSNADTQDLLAGMVQRAVIDQSFRQLLLALQQSQQIDDQLRGWQQQMAHYSMMLDERQQQRVSRAQNMLQTDIFQRLPALQNQRDSHAERLIAAQKSEHAELLMPPVFQQSVKRLNRALQRHEQLEQRNMALQQPALKSDYADRLRRLEGILHWQASEEFTQNSWQAQKQLQQLDAALAAARARQEQLLVMLAQRPDYAEQRQRVAQLDGRINQQVQNNQQLQQQLVAQLSDYLQQQLSVFKQQVEAYTVQAQLALVRLNDQALQQNQGDLPTPADIGRPPQLSPVQGEQP